MSSSNSKKYSEARGKRMSSSEAADFGNESDIVSFWLLLLFVAVFFGIAAEEAHGPLFRSADVRTAAAREFDLTSRSLPEKTEVPATGK